jgi:orotate phosphoribosyltransferase-like protein
MNINTTIVTVITKDFSFVKTTLENCNSDNIVKSLNTVATTLNKSAKSISDLQANSTNAIFVPYFSIGQILQEIKEIPEDVILLCGIDHESEKFKEIKVTVWQRYQKIIVGENHKAMAENFTQEYVDMFIAANPINPNLSVASERTRVDTVERYAKFVELINNKFTMKEIATELDLSIPSVYLIRTQFKDRLLNDNDVNKKAPAMKFSKTKTATG